MSKSDENNSCHFIKNNSSQNIYLSSCHKNQSHNIFDSATNIINGQHHSPNSRKNSKNKERNNSEKIPINKSKSQKNENKNEKEENIKEEDLKNDEEKTNINNLSSPLVKNKKAKKLNMNLMKENNQKFFELEQNSLKDIRKKFSKICDHHSTNTPKQILSIYNGRGMTYNKEKRNILAKKNLKLGIQRGNISPNNIDRKITRESKGIIKNENNSNKNDFVKYVNNDKYNFNGNILNMTQSYNQAKYVLSQSKSFTKVEKKNSVLGFSNSNNNIFNNNNNGNNLQKPNFNYINYNKYKTGYSKKKDLTVLTKNNSTYRNNKNEYKNNMNGIDFQNISTSPNSNNHIQSYFNNISKKTSPKNNISSKTANNINRSKKRINGNNKNNEISNSNISNININYRNTQSNSNKNIYFMKPVQQRKRSPYGKNHEISLNNKDNTTNQSSFGSKNKKDNYKNTLDSTFLSDIFNKNIDNPEELHFFYIKILQNGKEISKKFEIDNI